MELRGATVFCTGAAGFIGGNLYGQLQAAGARVIALALPEETVALRPLPPVYRGRVEDPAILRRIFQENEIDYVVHLAADAIVQSAYEHPLGALTTNTAGTWNLLQAVRVDCPRLRGLIYTSTDKVYGEGSARPYQETDPLAAAHIYDVSKACADMIVRSFCGEYGIPAMVVRFCNVYGGGDLHWTRLVPKTLRALHEGRRPEARFYRGPDGARTPFRRDFVYVGDVVDGLLRMLTALAERRHIGEAFNFGTARCYDVGEVVRLLCRAAGYPEVEPKEREVERGEILTQCMSYQKAERLLGFSPRVSLEEGLRRTAEWYRREIFHEG